MGKWREDGVYWAYEILWTTCDAAGNSIGSFFSPHGAYILINCQCRYF